MVEQGPAGYAPDLSACDREPIHIIGHIQPFGILIALNGDWRVSHVSANIAQHGGRAAADWLDRPLAGLIGDEATHLLRNGVARLHDGESIERCFAVPLIEGRPPFDVAVHRAGETIVIEAEPAAIDERNATGLVRAMIARLRHGDAVATLLGDGARHVQALTGFDRVMVYRFAANGDGEVVAEALRGRSDSYLGLHYPASDIPAQARALYLRNMFRVVADVSADPVPIVSAGDPLDQSLSMLRAVSSVHIQYLRNMDVAASLSISIIVEGRLWGLFACHHSAPRLPSFAYRTAAELFGQMFSMMLEAHERRDDAGHDMRSRAVADLLRAELAHNPFLLNDPKRIGELLSDVIPADGIALSIDGETWLNGVTPDAGGCDAIIDDLVESPSRDGVVAGVVPPMAPVADGTDLPSAPVGFLAVALLRRRRDHILLFRCERLRAVDWAGQPGKMGDAQAGPLSPRSSFAAWTELVRGQCDPFTPIELRAAEMIRVVVLETMVRTAGVPTIARHSGSHELLLAELNHRVRSIVSLIRGLISQTRDGAETTESFVTTLDDRVQALARAHDQVTSICAGPARLADLIGIEAAAVLGPGRDRIRIEGPPVLLRPTAFSTLSLVFHELMTNAVKYGALSGGSGQVSVIVAQDGQAGIDGDLSIDWIEQDGPAICPPARRGFGSTIIERSIPHDLGGAASVAYPPAGIEVHLRIPARHVAGLAADPDPVTALPIAADHRLLAGKTVLLVEDNMIIAMGCEDALNSLGAGHVTTAESVASALGEMEARRFDFALLDFNLGDETSIRVADMLAAAGIPFAFATGYDGEVQRRGHLNAPVIGKPYGVAQLVPVLHRMGFGAGQAA